MMSTRMTKTTVMIMVVTKASIPRTAELKYWMKKLGPMI